MSKTVLRVVADLGNSRLKWARLEADGRLAESLALPISAPDAWAAAWESWNPRHEPSEWAIATVNPPLAALLERFLVDHDAGPARWFRSAADVPVKHQLDTPETAGADRALAVAAALARHPGGQPGLVVSCGSAITVERIAAEGVWQGGAIAPGLGLSARALHLLTAQLPLVSPRGVPTAWGRSTGPALEAGLFWGVIGSVRELLSRQAADLSPRPWLVWTGGDAARLAPWIDWPSSQVAPDLVLEGLRQLAFPAIPA